MKARLWPPREREDPLPFGVSGSGLLAFKVQNAVGPVFQISGFRVQNVKVVAAADRMVKDPRRQLCPPSEVAGGRQSA